MVVEGGYVGRCIPVRGWGVEVHAGLSTALHRREVAQESEPETFKPRTLRPLGLDEDAQRVNFAAFGEHMGRGSSTLVRLLQVRSRLAAAKESPEPSPLYFQSTNGIVPPTTHSQPSSTWKRRNGAGDERSRSEHFPEALSRMSSFSAVWSSPSATRMAGVFPPLSVTLRSTPASQKLSQTQIFSAKKRGLSQTTLNSPLTFEPSV